MTSLILIAVAFVLAFANGANDVSKGVATLVGSGIADCRRAILWGAGWTAVGGVLGFLFSGAMIATFAHGLLATTAAPSLAAALATICGAAAWVLIATRTGLPVSTTHAIVGSLVGVGTLAYGAGAIQWTALWSKIALPLVASPVAAFVLTALVLRTRLADRADCLCASLEPAAVVAGSSVALVPGAPRLHLDAGTTSACAVHRPYALRLTLERLHWLTSGGTSLARAMNDAPKMVALLVAASLLAGGSIPVAWMFAIVTVAMVGGSLTGGKRVTRLLAEKVTTMSERGGFAANLITAGLVIGGAVHGLPMSTTHVASGGIIGASSGSASLNRGTLRDIALAWVVTLPGSAALGITAYVIARAFGA